MDVTNSQVVLNPPKLDKDNLDIEALQEWIDRTSSIVQNYARLVDILMDQLNIIKKGGSWSSSLPPRS